MRNSTLSAFTWQDGKSDRVNKKGVIFMKKRVFSVLVPLLLVCILSAQAAQATEQRVASGRLDLFFQGTKAICSAICQGSSASSSVDATLTLYQGSAYIDSWSASGTGKVTLYGECKVTSGNTYRLELAYSVDGVAKPVLSTESYCP